MHIHNNLTWCCILSLLTSHHLANICTTNCLIALLSPSLNGYTWCAFVPSDIAPQFPIQERSAHCLFAGVAGLHKRAYIILLKEFLAVDQDEGGVLQNHSLALPKENRKHVILAYYPTLNQGPENGLV